MSSDAIIQRLELARTEYTNAYDDYSKARIAYRAREIGDSEFISKRNAMQKALEALEDIEAQL